MGRAQGSINQLMKYSVGEINRLIELTKVSLSMKCNSWKKRSVELCDELI